METAFFNDANVKYLFGYYFNQQSGNMFFITLVYLYIEDLVSYNYSRSASRVFLVASFKLAILHSSNLLNLHSKAEGKPKLRRHGEERSHLTK